MKSIYQKQITLSYLLWIICLFMLPGTTPAQVQCSNKRLSEIHEQWKNNEQAKEWPVIIGQSPQGINHIGIYLFDRKIIATQTTPIYSFIERYFLEILLTPTHQEILNKLKSERVRIHSDIHSMIAVKEGLLNIIADFSSNQSIQIICHNNRYIVSVMKDQKNLLKMSFPVRYELIGGYTKMEAESSFYPRLLQHKSDSILLPTEAEMFAYQDSLYYINDDFYLTEDFISTSFYEKNEGRITPVFSEDMLMESVYNLFNAPCDRNIEAELTQSMYGGRKLSYNLPLAKLVNFLQQENCSLYTAIRKVSKSTIEGVVMAINSDMGYQHMFLFSFPRELFHQPDEHEIKMKMYAYIPIHNVSSLFESKKTMLK